MAITVILQPTGLEGQTAHVRLFADMLVDGRRNHALIGEKDSPLLTGSTQKVQFIYKPQQPGRVDLVAEVDRLPGEVNRDRELAHGRIDVLDDYLRLLFVEYEPTWEWRFIKEVFHRDRLVGMKGFRTFLIRPIRGCGRATSCSCRAWPRRGRVLRPRRDLPGRHAGLGAQRRSSARWSRSSWAIRRRAGGALRSALRSAAVGRNAVGRHC